MKILGAMMLLAATAIAPAVEPPPYSDQKDATIKALSAEEMTSLRDGQGMGFAKAAELNGYPGPKHVLELATPLALSKAQRRATEELFERMRAAARATGEALVEAERELDALYASKTATVELVDARLTAIEALRKRLRGIHLNAHLEQAALLNADQIARYGHLRGYGSSQHGAHH